MGMPAPATKEWTYEMLETLPDDGNRFEIIDGELLVSQAPTWSHQGVLWDRGRDYRSAKRGRAGYFRHPARCRPEIRIVEGHQILTPSTARADRHRKRLLYQLFNVSEYWIVDSDARVIDRWRPADARAETLS